LFGRSWFDRASTALAMRLCRCDWGFFPAALRRLRSKCSVAKLPTIDSSGRRPTAFMARTLAIGITISTWVCGQAPSPGARRGWQAARCLSLGRARKLAP